MWRSIPSHFIKRVSLNKRLQSTNANSSFTGQHLTFDEYINKTRELVTKYRVDLDSPLKDTIIKANTPAQFIPQNGHKKGVLLIHGLLDSPGLLQSVFDSFAGENYLVRSLALPGHGTVPGDLLHVSVESWLDAVEYAIDSFNEIVDDLTVVGFSTGASLALYHTLKEKPISALVMFAPAILIKNPLAFTAGWARYFTWLTERASWFHIGKDNDYCKYQSIAFNGIHQVYRLTKMVDKITRPANVPMFIVASDSDEAISTPACEKFFAHQFHPDNKMLIYSHKRQQHSHPNVRFSNSAISTENILDFSHVCLAVSEDHAHYGKKGDYQDFSHYQNWWGNVFPRAGDIHYGAVTPKNLKQYNLCRLTYNPDYPDMMNQIFEFLKTARAR